MSFTLVRNAMGPAGAGGTFASFASVAAEPAGATP